MPVMQVRRASLLSVFSAVLVGCGCPDETFSDQFTATEEEVEPHKDAAGEVTFETCVAVCEQERGSVEVEVCELVSYDPEYTEAYLFECAGIKLDTFCTGRRPAGLASVGGGAGGDSVGGWLAEAAHLEAASVPAFEQLAQQLRALGAPFALVAEARRAARDEIEHARVMGAWARAHGCEPAAVRLRAVAEPDLEALARDNAVEGCVRETWGALLAWVQAGHAEDLELRATLARIARDETRHAELARSIAAWLEPRLSAEARARVRAARDAAVQELRRGAGLGLAEDVRTRLGLPDRELAMGLLDRLQPRLWAA